MDYKINDNDLTGFVAILQELPYKYANKLIQFLEQTLKPIEPATKDE